MLFKASLISLAVVCCIATTVANDSSEEGSSHRTYSRKVKTYRTYEEPKKVRYVYRQEPKVTYKSRPVVKYYKPKPTVKYYEPEPVSYSRPKYSKSYSNEYDDAKYSFGYQAQANGKGYGSGSGESSSNFGHSETRDGDKTEGRYFVDLPDGRRQTVEYYVNGDSGYVAKVSYSGDGHNSAE